MIDAATRVDLRGGYALFFPKHATLALIPQHALDKSKSARMMSLEEPSAAGTSTACGLCAGSANFEDRL